MGGKFVAKGTGKGSSKSSTTVIKPWDKARAVPTSTKSYSSGAAQGMVAPWTKRAEVVRSGATPWAHTGGKSTGKSTTSKGKGKGKEKGKRKGAAPKKSQFWVRKVEEENRQVIESEPLSGTVDRYVWKQGWGFILPDSADDLPQHVRKMLKEATEKLKEAGKEPKDENLLYFRKPDVQANFRIKDESLVMFKVYTDDKGVGACEVCDPNAEDEEEADMEAEEANE